MTPSAARAARGPGLGLWASIRFWVGAAFETITRRRLSRLVRGRLGRRTVEATGVDAVPREGAFVLAVNHYHAGRTLDVIAAVLSAAGRARPEVCDACVIVVGQRARKHPSWWSRLLRWIGQAPLRRWSRNIVRIPMGNDAPQLTALREWRRRVATSPALVFPEGVARGELGPMRPGAGRWLARLPVPTLPVAAWQERDAWVVQIGEPIQWAKRADLHDSQLGLAIAEMLPPELATRWQDLLRRWRDAHDGGARTRFPARAYLE